MCVGVDIDVFTGRFMFNFLLLWKVKVSKIVRVKKGEIKFYTVTYNCCSLSINQKKKRNEDCILYIVLYQ